jgi:hypothetical protein
MPPLENGKDIRRTVPKTVLDQQRRQEKKEGHLMTFFLCTKKQ